MSDVYAAAEIRFNVQDIALWKSRLRISRMGTVGTAMLGLNHGDVIECVPTLQVRGCKPVIYLYSPSIIFTSATLTLIRQWKFLAIYPVVPIKRVEGHFHEESLSSK